MKKTILLFVAICITVNVFTQEVYSGKCGNNLTWALTTVDGVLTINGTGPMADYIDYGDTPWFDYKTKIKSVTISNGVTMIGNWAFGNCDGLSTITLPNSITSIGEYAFYFCKGLTSVTIPNSVTRMGDGVFFGCNVLHSVYITDLAAWCDINFMEAWGSNPLCYAKNFYVNNTLVTDLVIPNTVDSIKPYTFLGSNFLKSLTITSNVTSIGNMAFYGCGGLTSVTIPNSVTNIGYLAFEDCSGLTSVTIPNSVTNIGYAVFNDCLNLTSVVWDAKNCSDFSSTKTPFYCSEGYSTNSDVRAQITSFTFGDSVEYIPAYLCSRLTQLPSITIPYSVNRIGDNCFALCEKLGEIIVGATTPPTIAANTFYDVNRNIPVIVPAGSLEAYEADIYWNEFINITEAPTAIKPVAIIEGVFVENGVVVYPEPFEIFTISGLNVTKQNGDLLSGIYIVKTKTAAQKIVVN